MLKGKKLAVIGVGKIGEALVMGLLKQGQLTREDIAGSVKHETSIRRVQKNLGIGVSLDSRTLIQNRDIILLAVKPQNMDGVLREIGDLVRPHQPLIMVAASVTTSFVQERLCNPVPVGRAMPNTLC